MVGENSKHKGAWARLGSTDVITFSASMVDTDWRHAASAAVSVGGGSS